MQINSNVGLLKINCSLVELPLVIIALLRVDKDDASNSSSSNSSSEDIIVMLMTSLTSTLLNGLSWRTICKFVPNVFPTSRDKL